MSAHERHTEAGNYLRGVVRYGQAGPDPGTDAIGPAGVEVPPGAVEFFLDVSDARLDGGPYGSHRASIHQFEEVTVVHLPEADGGGIVATVEPAGHAVPIDALLERVQEGGQ